MDLVSEGAKTPTDFGKLVKRYRESRGISQAQLEALTGRAGTGYISQIESGARGHRISRDKVLAIAQALRADPVEFLQAAGRLEPGDTLSPEPRPSFRAFVETEPTLRSDQKAVLLALYDSWFGRR